MRIAGLALSVEREFNHGLIGGGDMQTAYVEKRTHNRVPLDIPLFILLETDQSLELPVQLLDCSRGGVQLAFAPKDEKRSKGMLNRRVRLMHLPRSMDPVDSGRSGLIAWISGGRCGVRFDAPLLLTDGEIREVSREL